MIRLAAAKADIIAFVPPTLRDGGLDRSQFTPDTLDTKIALLEEVIAGAGRTNGGPERNLVTFDVYPSLDYIADNDWIPRDVVATSPYALVGDADAGADALLARRERWGLS